MSDNIQNILGANLTEKIKSANKRQRRFQFNDVSKKEILVGLKENFEKAVESKGELRYQYNFGGSTYDIVLAKTYTDDQGPIPYRTGIGKGESVWHMTKFKYGLDFRKYMNAFLGSEEQFKQLVPGQEYVLIGYFKQGDWNGKPTYTFNVHELVALAEVTNELVKLRGSELQ